MKTHVILFQARFAELVRAGTKTQTIRPTRKRKISPGDKLSLRRWTRLPYRSKQEVLGEGVCERALRIMLWHDEIIVTSFDGVPTGSASGNEFAQRDGFRDWAEMRDWFAKTHGLPFEGQLITWRIM